MLTLAAVYITIQVSVVAWFDFKTKKISNIWPLVNLALFLVLPLLWPEVYEYSLGVWLVPLSFLIVGFILFKLDIMGAGDSKYLCSLFLLIPQAQHEELLLRLLMITVVVGGVLLFWRLVSRWEQFKVLLFARVGSLKEFLGGKFTYAPVILASWLWFLFRVGVK